MLMGLDDPLSISLLLGNALSSRPSPVNGERRFAPLPQDQLSSPRKHTDTNMADAADDDLVDYDDDDVVDQAASAVSTRTRRRGTTCGITLLGSEILS